MAKLTWHYVEHRIGGILLFSLATIFIIPMIVALMLHSIIMFAIFLTIAMILFFAGNFYFRTHHH
ncbi:MAG: hypothetical protein WC471_01870 [Candidatus Woesearchaeota archaeon]